MCLSEILNLFAHSVANGPNSLLVWLTEICTQQWPILNKSGMPGVSWKDIEERIQGLMRGTLE